MTSKGKEIYKTLKRQISGSVGGGSSSLVEAQASANGGAKYGGGSGKTWIHPPDVLINGRVEYTVRFLGTKEVNKSTGTDTIRDAIHAIRFQLQVKRSETGHSGSKLQKVDLQINVEGVTIVDAKTKMVLHRYPLQRISFCADDKQDKRVFSFIAKAEDSSRHDCFVFLSDKLAEQITLTVGEAFDLAYKRYMDKNRASLESQKRDLVLKKRIAELEEENQVLTRLVDSLRAQNMALLQGCSTNPFHMPALPTSPMPLAPPPLPMRNTLPYNNGKVVGNEYVCGPVGSSQPPPQQPSPPHQLYTMPTRQQTVTGGSLLDAPLSPLHSPSGSAPLTTPPPSSAHSIHSNPTPPPSIAPPPPIVPRRTTAPPPLPEVGRRLEGLRLSQMENVFDDSFDPRAAEKKKEEERKKKDDPFGDDFLTECLDKGEKASKATAADFEKMISQVDQRLAEMSNGFSGGRLEMGDTGEDTLRDIDVDSEYGTINSRKTTMVDETTSTSSTTNGKEKE